MTRRTVLLLILLASASTILADGTLMSWSPQSIQGMTAERWNAAKSLNSAAVLQRVRSASTWAECYEALLGFNSQPANQELIQGLIAEVSSSAQSRLSDTDGLIVWPRIISKDILFLGKGFWVEDDLFRTAGRANWLLRTVRKKHFGVVTPSSTEADLLAIQKHWRASVAGEATAEYRSPYHTEVKGLEELRSLTALEALIVSLQPSDSKDRHTRSCLKTLYHLDSLPSEPHSPGRLCNPDEWTLGYLDQLTGIAERHDSAWWSAWWEHNNKALVWNPEKGAFQVRAPAA